MQERPLPLTLSFFAISKNTSAAGGLSDTRLCGTQGAGARSSN